VIPLPVPASWTVRLPLLSGHTMYSKHQTLFCLWCLPNGKKSWDHTVPMVLQQGTLQGILGSSRPQLVKTPQPHGLHACTRAEPAASGGFMPVHAREAAPASSAVLFRLVCHRHPSELLCSPVACSPPFVGPHLPCCPVHADAQPTPAHQLGERSDRQTCTGK
jgi:hypothetical protein